MITESWRPKKYKRSPNYWWWSLILHEVYFVRILLENVNFGHFGDLRDWWQEICHKGDNKGKQRPCCFSNETEGAQKPTPIFRGSALPVSLCFLHLERERKKLCRSSLLPTLGPVGIHNHVLPPHSSDSDKKIQKHKWEFKYVARNRWTRFWLRLMLWILLPKIFSNDDDSIYA